MTLQLGCHAATLPGHNFRVFWSYFSGSDVCATFFPWKSKPHQGLSPRKQWDFPTDFWWILGEFMINFSNKSRPGQWLLQNLKGKQTTLRSAVAQSDWCKRNTWQCSWVTCRIVSLWILFDDDSGHSCHLAIQTVGFSLQDKQTQKTLGLGLPENILIWLLRCLRSIQSVLSLLR